MTLMLLSSFLVNLTLNFNTCIFFSQAVYITAIAPYVVLLALLIKGVTLDGAYDGTCQCSL